MCESIKKLVRDLLFENGETSLTRVISLVSFIAFLVGSFYLMFNGKSWSHYETFATMTVGAGAGTQMVNKFINSKYNSDAGRFPLKSGSDQTVQTVKLQKDDKSVKV